MSAHTVFVLAAEGTPLTPTTPRRARVLLQTGQARPVWSDLGTFGIQMQANTRTQTPVCAVGGPVAPGPWLVVDDTYRPVRRRLHDTQPAKGGVRAPYSRGTVHGYRKGALIGTPSGKVGRLCGAYRAGFRYYDAAGKRQSTTRLAWMSTRLLTRPGAPA